MKFFILFLEVPNFNELAFDNELIRFKKNLLSGAQVTVIQTEQSHYDFLYNSLLEKANQERKKVS